MRPLVVFLMFSHAFITAHLPAYADGSGQRIEDSPFYVSYFDLEKARAFFDWEAKGISDPAKFDLKFATEQFNSLYDLHLARLKAYSRIANLEESNFDTFDQLRTALKNIDQYQFELLQGEAALTISEGLLITSLSQMLKTVNDGPVVTSPFMASVLTSGFSIFMAGSDNPNRRVDEDPQYLSTTAQYLHSRSKYVCEWLHSTDPICTFLPFDANNYICKTNDGAQFSCNYICLSHDHKFSQCHRDDLNVYEGGRQYEITIELKPEIKNNPPPAIAENPCEYYDSHSKRSRQQICQNVVDVAKSLPVWKSNLDAMLTFLQHAQRKRQNALEIIVTSKRASIMQRYAVKIGKTIGELETSMGYILAGDRLYSDIFAWKAASVLGAGPGGGLSTKYLLYFEPIGIARSQIDKFDKLSARLLELAPKLPPETVSLLKSELDNTKQQLNAFVTDLAAKGPSYQFQRQKVLTSARKSRISSPTNECREAITKFEAIASTARDDFALRQAGYAYVKEVDACAM